MSQMHRQFIIVEAKLHPMYTEVGIQNYDIEVISYHRSYTTIRRISPIVYNQNTEPSDERDGNNCIYNRLYLLMS